MRQTGKFIFAFGTLLFIALLAYTSACKREPVYIGYIDPNPIDTTGTPIDTTGGGDTTIITPPPPITHPCDPDSVYFTQQVLPILTSNCAMSGCHNVQSHKEGIILNNYTNTRNTGGINLGNPTNTKIYRVLSQSGGDRMPPYPMALLPLDQRALILKWIQQGAKDLTCDADCDTTNVTFTTSIMPIITLKCKGCHSGTNPSGSIALTNYTQVKATVTSGTLMGSILHQAGYVAMPQPVGSDQLPDCDIQKLQIWIAAGAPNN
jgi:uncharacterized membrane protein